MIHCGELEDSIDAILVAGSGVRGATSVPMSGEEALEFESGKYWSGELL